MEAVTILYTQDIRGNLARLPRFYTFLETLRPHYPHALLLDIGNACDEAVPHCAKTGGRSVLLALDALGYHAVNVTGFLAQETRAKLASMVTLGLVDERHTWRYHVPPVREEGIVIASAPTPALRLCVVAHPHEHTHYEAGVLWLGAVAANVVGVVQMTLEPAPRITLATTHAMPPNTPPHPVISATIELIEEEAG